MNNPFRQSSQTTQLHFSASTLLSKLVPLGLQTLVTILPSLPKLHKALPPSLVSAQLIAVLEISRHMQWLIPPVELDSRRFAINVEDLNLRCCFACKQGRFAILEQTKSHPSAIDLEISANLADFVGLACGAIDADTLFFRRRLKVSGDTELGLIVKNWLDATERPVWLATSWASTN